MLKDHITLDYELPFYVKSSMSWLLRMACIMTIMGSSFFVCILIYIFFEEQLDITGVFITLFFILFDALFIYMAYFYDIAKKGYIEITDDYLEFRDLYKTRRFQWDEIHSVGSFHYKGSTIIGIVLSKNINRKQSFWKRLNSALGDSYDISFALSVYPNVEENKILSLIQNKIS